MKNMNIRHLLSIVTLVTAFTAGCESGEKPKILMNDYFEEDSAPRATQTLFDRQSAIAAREDGILYPHHFTGKELNSLGKQKLDLVTDSGNRGTHSIYLNVPQDGAYAEREASVVTYLTGKGMASESYTLTSGGNPNLGTPAVQGLNGLAKQSADTGAAGSSDSAASSSAASK